MQAVTDLAETIMRSFTGRYVAPLLRRDMTRAEWKVLYRQVRINEREYAKVYGDMVVYGSAAWREDAKGGITRVPPEEMVKLKGGQPCR